MPNIPSIPRTVASYYASAPATHKETLFEMRTRILEVVPLADEIIKYAMPTFVVDGVEVAAPFCSTYHNTLQKGHRCQA